MIESMMSLQAISRLFSLRLFVSLISVIVLFSACDNDDVVPELENEEEEITTVKLTFDAGDDNDIEVFWRDLDGDGGSDPTVDAIILEEGKSYEMDVEFLNENENEDITEEVKEEGEEHQLFFTGTAVGSLISLVYVDSDGDGNPLGLKNDVEILQKGGPSVLTIILRHEPNKTATGVAQGNIDNAGGETDVQVDFNITVQ